MFKVLILSLLVVACACRPQEQPDQPQPPRDPSPEQIQADIDQFKHNLEVKYEETKNAGRQGFESFLNYLQGQKTLLDSQFEKYREQQHKADEIRVKIQDLAQYLRELKEKAVDDAVGWTQQSADAANALWEQIRHYEHIPKEQVVRTRRSDDAQSDAGQAMDHAKEAVSKGWEHSKDSASEAAHKASDAASEAWDASKDSASEAAHKAGDAASEAWDASKHQAGAAYDHAKESVKSAASDVEENMEQAKADSNRERHPWMVNVDLKCLNDPLTCYTNQYDHDFD